MLKIRSYFHYQNKVYLKQLIIQLRILIIKPPLNIALPSIFLIILQTTCCLLPVEEDMGKRRFPSPTLPFLGSSRTKNSFLPFPYVPQQEGETKPGVRDLHLLGKNIQQTLLYALTSPHPPQASFLYRVRRSGRIPLLGRKPILLLVIFPWQLNV